MKSLESRITLLEAENEILRVLFRYCHHLDHDEPKELLTLFAKDGVLDVRYRKKRRALNHTKFGHKELEDWAVGYNSRRPAQQRHMLSAPVIRVRGKTANVESYFSTIDELEEGPKVVASGKYKDKFVVEKGRWVIKKRVVEVGL